jgi:hypothetical protein
MVTAPSTRHGVGEKMDGGDMGRAEAHGVQHL